MKNIESSSHFAGSDSLKRQLLALSREAGIPIDVVDHGEYLPPIPDHTLGRLPQYIRNYVQAPTIVFETGISHTVRRAFATCLHSHPDVSSWYESNRLRYNHLMGLSLLPLIFETELRSFQQATELITRASDSIPASTQVYGDLPLEERIAITARVAQNLKEAYQSLKPQD